MANTYHKIMPEIADFSKSRYTAVISDLHLCEAEPVNPRYPLWKKFKTRQFFFDDIFSEFLEHLEKKAKGETIELVLNGDIFDFDSVLKLPEAPVYRISWLEKKRGLMPRPGKSRFKFQTILNDHNVFVSSLRNFILKGHRAIFVIGNHDLEMHFPEVQEELLSALNLPVDKQQNVRIADWFYISNKDTLIEHGNQYDPYCVCENPVHPFSQGYNYKSMRLPFGNLACRYLMNGMGFFNPHVDTNYIMSLPEYIRFFLKYMSRAQPGLIITWFSGALITLWYSFVDRLNKPVRDPMKIEDRVNKIAFDANAEPRMVRELRELFAEPASSNPFLVAKELWLDRAFFIFVGFFLIAEIMIVTKQLLDISFFWAFIPLFLLLPFFLFYSKSVVSMVSSYKEPEERTLAMAGAITKVKRIIFGHTHHVRHEMIGAIEHLNSGTWSPAFLDVECTRSIDQKTFIWIEPGENDSRKAKLLMFKDRHSKEVFQNVRQSP
jgi:UDP-2,3-diacylglucosamine pyrophosphatase LpxH